MQATGDGEKKERKKEEKKGSLVEKSKNRKRFSPFIEYKAFGVYACRSSRGNSFHFLGSGELIKRRRVQGKEIRPPNNRLVHAEELMDVA
jgi:hypothetical protein